MIRPRAAAKTQHRHILVVSVVLMEGGPTQGRPPGHDVARARHPPTPQAFFSFTRLPGSSWGAFLFPLPGSPITPPCRHSLSAPSLQMGTLIRARSDAVLAIARALAPPTREAGVCASSTPTFPPMAAATRALVEDLRVGTSLKSWPTESTRSLVVPQPFFAKAAFHLRRRRLPVTFLPRPSVSPLGPLGGGPEA
ncbi:hypothetical protein B0T11DRAFT_275805 [Plectosphaerella cucumerina]|uniref:Uncharacterized protein n=1 Tax=Plectosphaerella cucumerina TaxID=40658 RepID=A0A8K0TNA9_9PEZI|nr:hypothetical protein B0T11DRAFT_275805 [Plectosphaerella cucumerina]